MALEALGGGPDTLQVVNPVLTNVAVQFRPHGFAYDQIVQNYPVEFNNGQYPFFDIGSFYASTDGRPIADDATTPLIDANYELKPYHCIDYRKAVRILRKELQQAHPALHLEESKMIALAAVFAGEREIRIAKQLRHTANSGQLTGGHSEPSVKWDKGTKSSEATIQADLQTARVAVYEKTGIWPNTLVITQIMAEAIANDFTVKQQLQYTLGLRMLTEGPGILPPQLFGLNLVIVGGAQKNGVASGETAKLEEIWGKHARVLYVDPNPGWGKPTVAYGFRGKVQDGFAYSTPAVANGGPVAQLEPNSATQYMVVDQWAEPDPPANRYRLWECVDERIVAPELGYELENVLT
jgi:hypothetical protein